jgi:hypothetical protein
MPLLMLLSDYKSRRSNKNKKASQSSVKKKGKLSIGLLHKPPRLPRTTQHLLIAKKSLNFH